MDVTLRELRPTDYQKLMAMYAKLESVLDVEKPIPCTAPQIQRWLHSLRASGAAQFVIAARGSIIGHALLCPNSDKTEAELALFLHPRYRGLGLGKELLLGVLNHGCKRLLLNRVRLSTQLPDFAARHLFERVGFRSIDPERPWHWEVQMERSSHCAHCKGRRCLVFSHALPTVLPLPVSRSHRPWNARFESQSLGSSSRS